MWQVRLRLVREAFDHVASTVEIGPGRLWILNFRTFRRVWFQLEQWQLDLSSSVVQNKQGLYTKCRLCETGISELAVVCLFCLTYQCDPQPSADFRQSVFKSLFVPHFKVLEKQDSVESNMSATAEREHSCNSDPDTDINGRTDSQGPEPTNRGIMRSPSPPGRDTISIAPCIFVQISVISQLITTLEHDCLALPVRAASKRQIPGGHYMIR